MYAARDEQHNEARVIAEELERHGLSADARTAAGRNKIGAAEREVDDASRQSFPASDSPAWSKGGTISRPGSGGPKG